MNYVLKQIIGTLTFFAIIFLSAGRIDYWQGLIYVIIGIIMLTLNYTVLRIDSDLIKERSKPGEGTKKWDKKVLGMSSLATFLMCITAGMDSGRCHWSPGFNWSLHLSGIILTISGQLLFLIAQKQNSFFSSTARIQTDRNHKVCDTGLYRFVRHPAYLGSVIQSLGFPLLFGSLWSIIPAIFIIILCLLRIYLEDRMLMKELRGYSEYSIKTRYRIIPFIW